MKYKLLAVVFPLLAYAHSSMAQVYEKSGLPCVAEICIGDGLSELAKVKWDRATETFSFGNQSKKYIDTIRLDSSSLKSVQSKYKGDIGKIAQFLNEGVFDNGAVSGLSNVTAQCGRDLIDRGLKGTYTTESGNPTAVYAALMPDKLDASKQVWNVISIERRFPAAVSNEQISGIKTQLKERYTKFPDDFNAKKGGAAVSVRESLGIPFYLSLRLNGGNDISNRLMLHPLCGGSTKVKID
jgi:hypothetical protein